MQKTAKIRKLAHNGVLVPAYGPQGFAIGYDGRKIKLTPDQEEMAVSWARKLGTDYVKDPVFARNFARDFSKALGLEKEARMDDFDFSRITQWLEKEKTRKEKMPREEKRALAEAREKIRETNREKYGYAVLNGEKVEIANYMVEPPSIFMGRGKHPLRGRWKPSVEYEDITLNLSEDAPTPKLPAGRKWSGRVFDPTALWVARWRDKLADKMKYVWISETARPRQEREMEKFNTALKLQDRIEDVRRYILQNLNSKDMLRRKVATVAYLIDALKLRVGDEKEKDEADTVGATTLRGAHVKINSGGKVNFDFLGKDSVRWTKTVELPPQVVHNLKSLIKGPRDMIFNGVRSNLVNSFLNEAMPGLTAKVFRTYHATKIVSDYLSQNNVSPSDPEIKKKFVATSANLRAAIACNHKRKLPKSWESSMEKKTMRLKSLEEKLRELRDMPKTMARLKRMKRLRAEIKSAKLKLEMASMTKNYNLVTSLKSYIDPRVYAIWAKKNSYDWKQVYPKSLQRKLLWVEEDFGKCQSD
ncbi:MAG: DNA topoisomerase I [Candidatus Hadarchaeota archaeon]